jgi:hypothetical protein
MFTDFSSIAQHDNLSCSVVVPANKSGGVTVTQTNVLLIRSQYVSAQIGHDQVILEQYANGDENMCKTTVLV